MTSPRTPSRTSPPNRASALHPTRASAPRPARRAPARWRVRLWRLRFVVAALCLAAATATVAARLEAPPAPTRPLVVAAHALVAGEELTAGSVRVAQVPAGDVPDGAHGDPADVVGRSVAIALPAGLAVTDPLLAGGAPAGPPGTVVIPIRFADAVTGRLLRAGDRVDVLAAAGSLDGTPGDGLRLARRALVLSVDPDGTRSSSLSSSSAGTLLGTTAGEQGSVVLLAVSPEEAAALAGASSWSNLSPVFVQ